MAKIDIKQTDWNLTPLFASDNDPKMAEARQAVEQAASDFVTKWRDRPELLTTPDILLEAVTDYEAWQANFGTQGNEGYYFWLRSQQDENDPAIKAKVQSITDFGNDILNRIQFFELEIAKITPELQAQILADARFTPFKHFLSRLFETAKYSLTEAEERIMNLKTDTSYTKWVDLTSGFIAKATRPVTVAGQLEQKGLEELLSLCSSQDKAIRDEAAAGVNSILADNADIAEAEINAVLANKKTNDEIRGYDRPDTSRHVADDFETAVIDSILEVVSSYNDIANQFYTLKAKLLGQTTLAYHERNIDYGQVDQDYSFEQAVELVQAVCARLDPEFSAVLERFLAHGQIDVYPHTGKRGGAMCAYNMTTQPTYMLLNFTSKLRDVTTLAHELGHGINDELMRGQNSLNFGTPVATAEVASQFLEDFVLDELAASADDELKLALNMSRLNDAVSSIFRQIACYRFEQALHNDFRAKGYLSKADIGKLFQEHMHAYMGDAVEQSVGSENWWVYWSHIRTFFYVYSYASGLLIARALQAGVRADARYIDKVKAFLAAGCSDSPRALFNNLGVDITDRAFWAAGLDELRQLLTETSALADKLHP